MQWPGKGKSLHRLYLAVILGEDRPPSLPVDVRGGVGRHVAVDGEVGLLQGGVVLPPGGGYRNFRRI